MTPVGPRRHKPILATGIPFDFTRRQGQIFPSVVINESLQRQLGAEIGDDVLLSFRTRDDVPDDTLLGNKENIQAFGSIRGMVVAVIPGRGIGRFSLSPHQAFPSNAYVALPDLQAALDQEGNANAVLVAGDATAPEPVGTGISGYEPPAQALLREILGLDDLGLLTEWHDGRLLIESTEFVLRPATVGRSRPPPGRAAPPRLRVTSYLANTMTTGTYLAPLLDGGGPRRRDLRPCLAGSDVGGSGTGIPSGNQILLNEWAAADLEADVGDTLRMEYLRGRVLRAARGRVVGVHGFRDRRDERARRRPPADTRTTRNRGYRQHRRLGPAVPGRPGLGATTR